METAEAVRWRVVDHRDGTVHFELGRLENGRPARGMFTLCGERSECWNERTAPVSCAGCQLVAR